MLLPKDKKGFTIIEVMIVLAIGGLIMALVFLAVPALQRNSRNTGRRSDVSRIGAAVSEWIADNNGAAFVAGTGNANLTSVVSAVGNLSQYTLTPGTNFLLAAGAQAVLANNPAVAGFDKVVINTGAQCSTGGATTAGTARQMAIQYLQETGGGTGYSAICQNI